MSDNLRKFQIFLLMTMVFMGFYNYFLHKKYLAELAQRKIEIQQLAELASKCGQ